MDLKSGQAVIRPTAGKSFDPTKIPKAVKDAGFTPGEIEVTATGTLARENGLLRLKMLGPVQQFVLAGGAKVEELNNRSDLLGKRVQVTGKLHPSHADQPPGLTVDSFVVLSKRAAQFPCGLGNFIGLQVCPKNLSHYRGSCQNLGKIWER